MNHIIAKKTILKVSIVSLASLFSLSATAAEGGQGDNESWGSPIATYSNVNLGSGSQGVDISVKFGGYLGGLYQHRAELSSKEDLEYYEVNYLLLNTASDSGISIETSWNENLEFKQEDGPGDVEYDDVDSAEVGLFSKLSFSDARFNAYPKMSVGYMWGNDISETTYVQFEVALRFNLTDMFWFGGTPVYTHSMEGIVIDEFTGTLDAGAKLSETFGVSASVNEDQEFLGRVIFAF